MTTTIAGGRAARRQTMRRIRPRRSPAVPLLLAVFAGAAGVIWLWWSNTPSLADTASKWLAAGRITGLLAGYLMALVVLQMARVPALERRVGSDRVARWHAMSGRYTLSLVVAHVVMTMYGYALQAGLTFGDIVQQTIDSVNQLPDMGKAAIGTGVLVFIGLISMGPVRRRIPYDLWYHVHLLTYVATFMTFWHQLSTGNEFVVEPIAKTVWYALYGTVTALVVWYRILTPIRLNMRHRLRVEAVIEEAPGVASVLMSGRKLHRMGAEAGHFFRWRFLAPGMRFSSHPYSLSAAPRPNMLRITVKAAGNHSSALRDLAPGTRVWAEGPYGAMTAGKRSRGKVLLVAGGVGITPMRALFETLPAAAGDLTLLYRANSTQDLALWDELASIAEERGARLMYAVNSPEGERPDISPDTLRRKIPDIDEHDVFMCGPPGFAQQVYEALRGAGVPTRRIHHESFEM
ncbi:ferredoxin reductase family protein [Streptomyces sp. KM273126]|uniref:ferredoxin reductase family protein n=1 Tax=Streptomyces sp. KM273126 TaxID=2545247 RepID=UPI001404C4B0|nr:ferredoxin reductase family protein [Streptomyces sp. KM273126]MBA2812522.1 ferredoxin reductase family protein [Streptomyces sp. KM273126]